MTVAQFVESSDHNVLLVREDWLKRTLRKAGLDVIFGWLGEKQLLEKDGSRFGVEVVGGWTEINAGRITWWASMEIWTATVRDALRRTMIKEL